LKTTHQTEKSPGRWPDVSKLASLLPEFGPLFSPDFVTPATILPESFGLANVRKLSKIPPQMWSASVNHNMWHGFMGKYPQIGLSSFTLEIIQAFRKLPSPRVFGWYSPRAATQGGCGYSPPRGS